MEVFRKQIESAVTSLYLNTPHKAETMAALAPLSTTARSSIPGRWLRIEYYKDRKGTFLEELQRVDLDAFLSSNQTHQ